MCHAIGLLFLGYKVSERSLAKASARVFVFTTARPAFREVIDTLRWEDL